MCWGSITKYHRLDDINNRHLFSYSPEAGKSMIKVLAGAVSRLVDDCLLPVSSLGLPSVLNKCLLSFC